MTPHELYVARCLRQRGWEEPEVASVLGLVVAKKRIGVSPDEGAEIERLWAEGLSAGRIAHAIGRPTRTVEGYARRHRDACPRRLTGGRIEVDMARVAEMRGAGMSIRSVAREMGVSATTLGSRIKEMEE